MSPTSGGKKEGYLGPFILTVAVIFLGGILLIALAYAQKFPLPLNQDPAEQAKELAAWKQELKHFILLEKVCRYSGMSTWATANSAKISGLS